MNSKLIKIYYKNTILHHIYIILYNIKLKTIIEWEWENVFKTTKNFMKFYKSEILHTKLNRITVNQQPVSINNLYLYVYIMDYDSIILS